MPLTASPWMSEEHTCTPVGRECGGLKLECTSIRTCTIAFLTRVYSWNTYLARLFVMNTWPDCFRICLYFRVRVVELLTVNTTCDFERGGAKKTIIGSSWNNSKKNCLDLCQVQKRSNVILLVVFVFLEYNVFECPSYPA